MEERARRSRHGQAFWLGHIVACEQAGGGVPTYLREHGLCAKSFYRWRKRLTLSGDLPVPVAAPMFQRLEVLPSPVGERPLPGCVDVLAGESGQRLGAVLEVISCCQIRLPNGAALELNGTLSSGLIGDLLQVAGALPVMDGRVSR